jgi:trimeric autotransporter adhesin
MKTSVILLATTLYASNLFAQGTAFTYQGRLNANGAPANGTYDLTFARFENPTGGGALLGPITNSAVSVSNGLFTTVLDFGPYNADAYGRGRWLEISVRTNGSGPLAILGPRQLMTPAPSAIYASYAGGPPPGGGFNADLLDGFDSAAFWQIGGNSGTFAGVNFLGTTDNQALAVKVNNVIALQFMPGTTLPNLVGGLGGLRPSVVASGVSGAVIAGGNAPSGAVNGQGGGDFHAVYDNDGTVGGGFGNKAGSSNGDITDGAFATVAGGVFNSAANYAATVCGGDGNFAGGQRSFIGGGYANQALADFSAAGGGLLNSISDNADYAVIGGGDNNSIGSFCTYATIGGGSRNAILYGVIGNPGSTVSGGTSNSIGGFDATIGGGLQNTIELGGYRGTIGGGEHNTIQYDAGDSTIAGGFYNTIGTNAGTATIGGGGNNRILPLGQFGTIPGGYLNSAASFAFAAGFRAKANHPGSFVWADSQNADFSSTANNQFSIRAQGGVRLNTDTSVFFGNQTRQMLNLWSTSYGIGVQNSAAYFRSDQEFMWYRRGSHSDTFADPGAGGTLLMRLGINGELIVTASVTAPSFVQSSDRNAKENFEPINSREVLEKVAALPITRWNFKQDRTSEHIGPMAQDFYAAFGTGSDDKHITTVDADGVALAAIQGLNEKVELRGKKSEDRIQKLEAENAELKQRLEKLEHLMENAANR